MLIEESEKKNKKKENNLPFLLYSSNKSIYFGGVINLVIWLYKKLLYLFYHIIL